MPATRHWHHLPLEAVFSGLQTAEQGLSETEARHRLHTVGLNQLRQGQIAPWWQILAAQFQDFMVLVLLVATGASYALGERADALTIVAIVFLNAILGFVQEYRAERSLEALKELSAPAARVRRAGLVTNVPATDVVPGDIIILESGDRVAADARLSVAYSLGAEESALTGESMPVKKTAAAEIELETPLGDRKNMVYMGTVLTTGRAEAVVVATGMDTEVGRIAGLIQEVGEGPTPLQGRLEQLGRWLVVICLGLCAGVAGAGVLRGEPLVKMFLVGVSLAVAAIPEGLPAIVTVALALGVQRMIKKNAIVRRLRAVETLGCATAILSDKTGTLTRNEMMLRVAYAGDRYYDVTGDGYTPAGDFRHRGKTIAVSREPALMSALRSAALCNNAILLPPGSGSRGEAKSRSGWTVQGDPTEAALIVAAAKAGFDRAHLDQTYPRLWEGPFSSERRRMSVLTGGRAGDRADLHLKGAPGTVLDRCKFWLDASGQMAPLTEARRRAVLQAAAQMAGEALRVLAIAHRLGVASGGGIDDAERDLVFLGLMGLIDPPRPEVQGAIALAARAGIRTVMVTGDHPATALAVAAELGIIDAGATVLTGADIENYSDDNLERAARHIRVFARVTPEHKLRIVRAFKRSGEIVAMTGDGVNDAPAVKEADIGVAMGKTGTDVTREASQLILADDNYATIVAAVEEGRGIHDNIRKFIRYLLACNTGEVLLMLLAALSKLPLPLLPMQILWVNLVTDGLPAMALGVDPPDADVMRRPPRPPQEGVFARGLGRRVITRGVLIGVSVLLLFMWGLLLTPGAENFAVGSPDTWRLPHARTLAFAGLVMAQLFHAFDCRSERRSIWEIGWTTNRWLLLAVAVSTIMLFMAIYWPPLALLMDTVPLRGVDWVAVLGVAGAGQVAISVRRSFAGGVAVGP